jgi:hypothetical protein
MERTAIPPKYGSRRLTRAELLHLRSLSPYYFFTLVVIVSYETTAAAHWASLFIVRTFFNYTFAVALWTSFHVARLTSLYCDFLNARGQWAFRSDIMDQLRIAFIASSINPPP